jgi:hypothetical protein
LVSRSLQNLNLRNVSVHDGGHYEEDEMMRMASPLWVMKTGT